MSRRTVSCRGFTLIELLAVIAVGAILSVSAAPLWRSPGGIDSAAKRCVHDLKSARAMALTRGVDVSLTLTGATSYVDPFGQTVDLARWSGAISANGPIRFNGKGEPTGATTITLTAPDGSRTITLPPSGLIAP